MPEFESHHEQFDDVFEQRSNIGLIRILKQNPTLATTTHILEIAHYRVENMTNETDETLTELVLAAEDQLEVILKEIVELETLYETS